MSIDAFARALDALPLMAILRGVQPDEVASVGEVLCQAGFTLIEVPLNSPSPFRSIEALRRHCPQALVGAGTVLSTQDVQAVAQAGGQLVVSPNFNPQVVQASVHNGLISLPGVFTPSEAFGALAAGAHALKLFPAEMASPKALQALRAVLPPRTRVLPVGGISPDTMAPWWAAGASGFGIGSALYRPGKSVAEVATDAQRFAQAWRDAAAR